MWARLRSSLRALLKRQRFEERMDQEMQFHLESYVEDLVKSGVPRREAERRARIEFGGLEVAQEECREARRVHIFDQVRQDAAYACRIFRKQPGFTAIAALVLALGIGANTAIFSLIDAVLLKMLPVSNPEQLVFLERSGASAAPKRSSNLPYAFFERLRAHHEALAGVCTFAGSSVNVVSDGHAEVARGERVSGGYFRVLGVNALLGRTIAEEDDKVPGGHPVVVISYAYWQRRFARDSTILGKSISLNGHPFSIIGVTPPDFFGLTVGAATDLWAPAMMYAQLSPGRSIEEYFKNPLVYVLARLRPEITQPQARSILTGLLQQSIIGETGSTLSAEQLQSLRQQSIAFVPAGQGLSSLRGQFSEPLRILMGVVGLILLIACANVANLLLARANTRQKEIAIRLALGASRSRLIRQLLTESILLSLIGGALGILLARWGSNLLLRLVSSGRDPIFLKLTLDVRILGFTAAVALLSGILFGLAPARRATRLELTPALKDSARNLGSGTWPDLGKALVVVQVALSMLLLIGAGLLVRSLGKLKGVDAGFTKNSVLLVSTDPRMVGYQGRRVAELYQRILDQLSVIPGVRSASLTRQGLLSGSGTTGSVYIQGRPARASIDPLAQPGKGTLNYPNFCQVGPGFFETMGMTIIRGRGIGAQDNENAPKVAVINETFARYFFDDEDPIGKRFGYSEEDSGRFEIIGIVKDAKYLSLRESPMRTFYVPYLQDPGSWRETTFQIRTVADPTMIISAVRQAINGIDSNLPLFNIKTLAAQVDEVLVQERLVSTLSGFFGLLSLLLAAIGLYGIMTHAVSQRAHEIGIRMALGANRSDVLIMVFKQGMRPVLLGICFGLAASLACTRIIASQLYGVSTTDLVSFVGVPFLLLGVAIFACVVPARRATRVDPLVALRHE